MPEECSLRLWRKGGASGACFCQSRNCPQSRGQRRGEAVFLTVSAMEFLGKHRDAQKSRMAWPVNRDTFQITLMKVMGRVLKSPRSARDGRK